MAFTWDEAKRIRNLGKHKVDFSDAQAVFSGETLTREDTREGYREQRFVSLGELRGVPVVIVHVERGEDTRILSMRKATPAEARRYYEEIAD